MKKKKNNNLFTKFYEKYRRFTILIFLIFLLGGWACAAYLKAQNNPEKPYNELSFKEKLSKLEKSYNYYVNESTSKELHTAWLNLFDDVTYEVEGNLSFDKADCLHSTWSFFKYFGSNVKLEDIPNMVKRLNQTSIKVNPLNKVHHGYIIIFNPVISNNPIYKDRTQIWHIGIVEKIFRGYIHYMDVNSGAGTRAFNIIPFGDRRIHAIYPVTFAFWIGDLYLEQEKDKEKEKAKMIIDAKEIKEVKLFKENKEIKVSNETKKNETKKNENKEIVGTKEN